jgi:hypothetical protein
MGVFVPMTVVWLIQRAANRADESGSKLSKFLSPKPVDKFVDNLPKITLPYCFPSKNINLPKN